MPKYNNAKNRITDLAITNQKEKVIVQVKVQTTKNSSDKTIVHAQSCSLQVKVHQYRKRGLQTWSTALTNRKIPKTKFPINFFKTKKLSILIGPIFKMKNQ